MGQKVEGRSVYFKSTLPARGDNVRLDRGKSVPSCETGYAQFNQFYIFVPMEIWLILTTEIDCSRSLLAKATPVNRLVKAAALGQV